MVMEAPGSPLEGVTLLMSGGVNTVKAIPLLGTPPAAVATMFPVVAPVGTMAEMLFVVQAEMLAGVPLNVTALPAP
jgi:hypothetical protein